MSSPDNISRSGRVRKKSSKLADFQSPEDAGKRQARLSTSPRKEDGLVSIFDPVEVESDSDAGTDLETELDIMDFNLDDIGEIDDLSVLSSRAEIVKKPSNLPQVQDVGRPGLTRITASMLWAKCNKSAIIRENPGLGPSALRIKLAELWNTVPKEEKLLWGKKVKKLTSQAVLSSTRGAGGGLTSPRGGASVLTSPRGVASRLKSPPPVNQLRSSLGMSVESRGVPGLNVLPETETINIASHLKLLGESLSVIGERLTEHEGQIAVSGSLSVLLDSLLCAMGPLISLTSRVPELNGADPRVLSDTLDNVAYIMPGL